MGTFISVHTCGGVIHTRARALSDATHPVRARDEDKDVGEAEYEQVTAGGVRV